MSYDLACLFTSQKWVFLLKVIHKVIFALVIVTILVVQLYWLYGDSRVLEIRPQQFTFLPTNDQTQGGISTSSLAIDDDVVLLECQLKKGDSYAWPFCGVSVSLGDSVANGINLTDFHTVKLDIDFEQVNQSQPPSLRFYLRNFNPAYSSVGSDYSIKYNGLEYTPKTNGGSVEIPIANLQVLTWWLADNNIPIAHSAPEFSNVTKLELATGSGHSTGQYRMRINSIKFVGSYLDNESLLLGLLIFWVSLALGYSVLEIRRSRQLIQHAHYRQDHLRKLNRHLKEQNVHFAELANRDALTGAMNRHSIRDWLDKNYTGEQVQGKQLSVLYLDIDHFKVVNDKYGHAMGDDILREFTMVVLSSLSASERLVRWGGEEFVVFCPGVCLVEATELAEKIRARTESHLWVHGDSLTTSIGVSSLDGDRTNDMLTRADEALYMAKRKGRNQVVVSD